MDIIDAKGKTVHYSGKWEPITFVGSEDYRPRKSFRIYVDISKTLRIKGTDMNASDAVLITLTEGYHNFVCDRVLFDGSDDPSGAYALF